MVWFRLDLRLADNPALRKAVEDGAAVLPVYIHAPDEEGRWPEGGASRWWRHQALRDLDAQWRELGGRLILRQGSSLEVLRSLVRESGACGVLWNRRYEPAVMARDSRIKAALKQDGIGAESFNGNLLFEPFTIANKSDKPFRVFTPFYKHLQNFSQPEPVWVDVRDLHPVGHDLPSLELEDLELRPRIAWDGGLQAAWNPTRKGVLERLTMFQQDALEKYSETRDIPGIDGTSRLSPYLHFGQIGPREVLAQTDANRRGAGKFIAEVYWREFAYNILYHFAQTPEIPLREEFTHFPWRDDAPALRAWQKGLTGYPIVDAGMRQLWQTGWMHNRLRMVVASFLVKHLLISWSAGARWFWDTLVDADLASNTLGWQWAGGCGADAAPYFRVFNPITQGEKFDPEGRFTRTFVPELAGLPDQYLFKPWEAPAHILRAAKVRLGEDYPLPIVDHITARNQALAAFEAIKKSS